MTVPVHGLPPMLSVGMPLAAVPPLLRSDRWHEVLTAQGDGEGQLVALSGVTNIGAAEELVGSTLLADIATLPEGIALQDVDALIGRSVEDETLGALGSITEVLRGPAQDVWVVEGPHGEVMLPVVDEVVIDAGAEGPIRVRAPKGSVSEEGEL